MWSVAQPSTIVAFAVSDQPISFQHPHTSYRSYPNRHIPDHIHQNQMDYHHNRMHCPLESFDFDGSFSLPSYRHRRTNVCLTLAVGYDWNLRRLNDNHVDWMIELDMVFWFCGWRVCQQNKINTKENEKKKRKMIKKRNSRKKNKKMIFFYFWAKVETKKKMFKKLPPICWTEFVCGRNFRRKSCGS